MTALTNHLQGLVREHYVFPDVAERIAGSLDGFADRGLSADRLAVELTSMLQDVNGDKHLRVKHHPDGVPEDQDEATIRASWMTQARATAGGIREVRREGDVSILVIGPVICPAELAAPYIRAAFSLLAGAERLVVDLRDCVGGIPETVALICSHFTGDEPVHLQDLVSRDGSVRQTWTLTSVSPKVPSTVTVQVLTSAHTFSGGEELAYDLQALGLATIVGEVTGGGAHPREAFRLAETLEATIPVARSVNATTGTNWEGVGVQPDVPCSAEQALDIALGPSRRGTDAATTTHD